MNSNINFNFDDKNRLRTHDERIIKKRKARSYFILGNFSLLIGSIVKAISDDIKNILGDFLVIVAIGIVLIGLILILKSIYLFFVYKE